MDFFKDDKSILKMNMFIRLVWLVLMSVSVSNNSEHINYLEQKIEKLERNR